MMSRLAILLFMLCLAHAGPIAATSDPSPFGEVTQGVKAREEGESIGLATSKTALLFHGAGILTGIWAGDETNLVSRAITNDVPLWSIEVTPVAGAKPTVITANMTTNISTKVTDGLLRITYHLDLAKVIVEAKLAADSAMTHWHIEVEMLGADLWSVTFPQIAIAAFEALPEANEMVVPYRRGQTRVFGKGAAKGDADLPYPGSSAKFQFMAAYGTTSGRGFYYAVEDGEGYAKSFQQKNRPDSDAVILATQHFPAGRGSGVRRYTLPYDVVTGPFKGDWWQAARLYREWWVKQVWASKGLLEKRKDIPQWLIHSPIATRPSTTKPARTVANNTDCMRALSDALGGQPFFGTWYGYPQGPAEAKTSDDIGHGHLWPPKPGLVDAVHQLAGRGVHLQAYIQSMIYDSRVPGDAWEEVVHAVTLDPQARPVPYGAGTAPHLLAMCRATPWWQQRLVELSQQAVREFGFDGIYLDSFGKGAPECFAKNHGHAVGGGNTFIAGQRVLAQKVRSAIRAINPEAIMSGEDPVEAFRDLLDVNLYAVNAMKNYVPVTRAVWGDYSLGHGRVLAPGKANNSLVPELALLFLEGTIPGRLYGEDPNPFLLQPAYAREFGFLKKLARYTEQGLPYLRLGEYLHPLDLKLQVPAVGFTESCEGQKVSLPPVMNSVTRSHTDGSVAIALVNISIAPQSVSVRVDPSLCRSGRVDLARMDDDGKLEPLASGGAPWRQPLTLQPLEVAFLVLK